MFKKNDAFTLTITDISLDGHGIGRKDGTVCFCHGCLPGEIAEVSVIKPAKNFCVTRPAKVLRTSNMRVTPPCPVFSRCGGCTLQHFSEAGQLEFKTRRVREALLRIGGLDVSVQPCAASPESYGYRNKAVFPVAVQKGRIAAGFYAPRSHEVVDIDACAIQHPDINRVFQITKDWLSRLSVPVYDETAKTGLVRRIFARVSGSGEVMAGLIASQKDIPHTAKWVEALRDIENLKSVMVNVNASAGNAVLGEESVCLYGRDTLSHPIDGLIFGVGMHAFLQVNTEQTAHLYDAALNLAEIKKTDTVADLFCGIGTISLLAARQAKSVVGIENVPQAVESARAAATANGIANADFICGDCSDAYGKWAGKNGALDVLIADPPRKGLDDALIDAILSSPPRRMVYISCDPGTLARDLNRLSESYTVTKVVPFDLFPQTTHVETVCQLCRRQNDGTGG